MTLVEALILGIIQGLTEFFPISSSAHLKLGEFFLGMKELNRYVLFDLVCHFGTLFAIICVLWRPMMQMFSTNRTALWQICIATLPLFPLLLVMKPIRALFDQINLLGILMMLNGCFLAFAIRRSQRIPEQACPRHWRDACTIGLAQACAILPGISRSGSTISTAWLLGWETHSAIIFSFLLSIPAVLGGIIYESSKLLTSQPALINPPVEWMAYLVGFFSSFVVGFFCFLLLLKLFTKERFHYFAWYCLIIGGAVTIYFNLGYP